MRKIVVVSMISLDGVMQAPGGPEEDTSGGFKHGGWTWAYSDEFSRKTYEKEFSGEYDLLLGRKTYDIWVDYWPKQKGPIADPFNRATKYVVSHHDNGLTWDKTVLIDGDVVAKLKKLKAEDGPMLSVQGSANMIQTLLKNDLVDELWLRIYPITLGQGKRLFGEGTIPAAFKLMDSKTNSKGLIFAYYKRAGDVKTGSLA
ncbi:MAG TPA: dihydrofolate reductase family protein [Candidatus Saccharimonadales bacterium]|nr:dihydrofolate reductase family protein [Candidatus Saccharimonadales bacterium]